MSSANKDEKMSDKDNSVISQLNEISIGIERLKGKRALIWQQLIGKDIVFMRGDKRQASIAGKVTRVSKNNKTVFIATKYGKVIPAKMESLILQRV